MKPPPPNALVNKLVGLTLALLIFAGSLGLGAVWVRQEIFQTANRNRLVEVKLADVQRRLDEVNAEVAAALNPDTLISRNERMRIGLQMPREEQVTRIAAAPETELARKRNSRIFGVARASLDEGFNFRVVNASLR